VICPTCFGNTTVPIRRDGNIVGVRYCPDCGGSGRQHCCEGDCSQPEKDQNDQYRAD
jgi:hypothetical protein